MINFLVTLTHQVKPSIYWTYFIICVCMNIFVVLISEHLFASKNSLLFKLQALKVSCRNNTQTMDTSSDAKEKKHILFLNKNKKLQKI